MYKISIIDILKNLDAGIQKIIFRWLVSKSTDAGTIVDSKTTVHYKENL